MSSDHSWVDTRREGQEREGFLGIACVVLAAVCIVAAFLYPRVLGPQVKLARVLFFFFLVYSIVNLTTARFYKGHHWEWKLCVHAVGLISASLITISTGGPRSPFLILYLMALLLGGNLWGMKGTLLTAGACVVLYLAPPIASTLFLHRFRSVDGSSVEGMVAVCASLVIAGYLLGHFAEEGKRRHGDTVIISRLRSRARAAERSRIAHELHDGVIQSLMGIEMQAEIVRRQAAGGPSLLLKEVGHLQQLLREEILDLRERMQFLKPVEVEPGQLVRRLAETVDCFRNEQAISAGFICDNQEVSLPTQVCSELVRILQEALVNVRKHSGARKVQVRFGRENGIWKLLVEDDGRGFGFTGRLFTGRTREYSYRSSRHQGTRPFNRRRSCDRFGSRVRSALGDFAAVGVL